MFKMGRTHWTLFTATQTQARPRLTQAQQEVLAMVRNNEVIGRCHHYDWTFTAGDRSVTKQINALRKKGFVDITYHAGNTASIGAR